MHARCTLKCLEMAIDKIACAGSQRQEKAPQIDPIKLSWAQSLKTGDSLTAWEPYDAWMYFFCSWLWIVDEAYQQAAMILHATDHSERVLLIWADGWIEEANWSDFSEITLLDGASNA